MKEEDKTEDEYFIQKRELGELFDSSYVLDVNLWRGQKPGERGNPICYPILKSFLLSNGRTREPDILTYDVHGELWVKATSGGVSLFDVLGVPVRRWDYYRLEAGTPIPVGLVITRDSFNKRFEATHYSVRPNWDMPLKKFLMLLDELAAKFVKEV